MYRAGPEEFHGPCLRYVNRRVAHVEETAFSFSQSEKHGQDACMPCIKGVGVDGSGSHGGALA